MIMSSSSLNDDKNYEIFYQSNWDEIWKKLRNNDKSCLTVLYDLLYHDERFWIWVVSYNTVTIQGLLRLPFVLSRVIQNELEDWMVAKTLWKYTLQKVITQDNSTPSCSGSFLRELLVQYGAYDTVANVCQNYNKHDLLENYIANPPLPPRVWAKYICFILQHYPKTFIQKAGVLLISIPSSNSIWKRAFIQNVLLSASPKDPALLVNWLFNTPIVNSCASGDKNRNNDELESKENCKNWLELVLQDVIETWSESSFVHCQNVSTQTILTEFLLNSLARTKISEHSLPYCVQGISNRLTSHSKIIRNHGLKFAHAFALQINNQDKESSQVFQKLLQEEEDEEGEGSVKITSEAATSTTVKSKINSESTLKRPKRTRKKKLKIIQREINPDEEFTSSDEENEEFMIEDSCEETESSEDENDFDSYNQQQYTDATVGFDTEEDLLHAPRPLYLQQAMEMLFDDKNDDKWYQETAMLEIPKIPVYHCKKD